MWPSKRARYDGASSLTSESHSSIQQSVSTAQLDIDLMNPVMTQGLMGPQTFNQPNITGQERTNPMSLYSPNMVVNTSDNLQMINTHPRLSQYPPGMMNRPQVQQQQQHQMMRMPTTPSRMMTPVNIQAPQPTYRYPTPFQTYDNANMRIYNRISNPGSSSVGQRQNFAAVRSNVNRPFLSAYRTPYSSYNRSPTPGLYQHTAPMMHDPFYPSDNNFGRYQAEQANLIANQNIYSISSVASSVVSSSVLSHQQQAMNNDGVTSIASNSDNHQSSTNMQIMSVSSSLPSSNNMISSGVTTNGVTNSVSSTSSMSLQQSSISESKQMGMRGPNMFGGPMAGPNPGVDMLPMSSPQVGQGMQQRPLNNDMMNLMGVVGGSGRPDMEQQMLPIQGAQSWHQDISLDLRQHLVRKLVTMIYPVDDQNELQDHRVMTLIQYVKKVEKNMFEVAQSRDQYYELMAEKIYKIRKELEERRKKLIKAVIYRQPDEDTFQCCTAAENLRKKYAELSDLPYNAMQGLLYAKKVITREEKKCIKTLVGSEKMECLLDVVIRSLKHNHCHKFKGFLEAMEESEDMLLRKTAKDLGGSEAVPADP